LGFQNVVVIDEDLGRTGSGLVERPGFQRLVAEVWSGEVGAVFCLEVSRSARNGRDWHHLIELCGLVDAIVVDADGVYDPNRVNDRLALGLKGNHERIRVELTDAAVSGGEATEGPPRRDAVPSSRGFSLDLDRQDREGSRSAGAAGP